MPTRTFRSDQAGRIPPAAAVSVYLENQAQDGRAPSGTPVAGPFTLGADSTVSLGTLADLGSGRYVAYAKVGSEHRYLAFTVS